MSNRLKLDRRVDPPVEGHRRHSPFHGIYLAVLVSAPMWAIVCAFIWWIIR